MLLGARGKMFVIYKIASDFCAFSAQLGRAACVTKCRPVRPRSTAKHSCVSQQQQHAENGRRKNTGKTKATAERRSVVRRSERAAAS